ncbi:epimerase [Pseudolysinimonas sp.]|jgi:NAD dependent epimerase/dehydratase family enzyme|uniref:epimerase n=1 Tax=Pseudolysinimonas sp. TaxID=2680009 RepID=UPI003783A0CE
MRIVVAGASGFMGTYLVERFRASGEEVVTIGRTAGDARWGDVDGIRDLVDGADVLINLAGKSVNCRYDEANRAEIVRSRVETTRALGDAVAAARRPPALWLNSSTATIYRHAEDRAMTEATGELGTGFSVGVARSWEAAFAERDLPSTRRVALRTAIVLGDGSALVPLLILARIGFGGAQIDGPWFRSRRRAAAGTLHEYAARGGRQRFSWIHLDDVVGIIRFLIDHDEIDGVVNVSAPNPVDSATVMRSIRRALRVPFGIPLHRWMLEPGAWAIRTETELVLKSRWVVPERLLAAGYRFAFPEIDGAIRDVVAHRQRTSRTPTPGGVAE